MNRPKWIKHLYFRALSKKEEPSSNNKLKKLIIGMWCWAGKETQLLTLSHGVNMHYIRNIQQFINEGADENEIINSRNKSS